MNKILKIPGNLGYLVSKHSVSELLILVMMYYFLCIYVYAYLIFFSILWEYLERKHPTSCLLIRVLSAFFTFFSFFFLKSGIQFICMQYKIVMLIYSNVQKINK